MAERVGFEPTKELPLRWFSRPVLSTAQPPLQNMTILELIIFFINHIQLKFKIMSYLIIFLIV